MLTVQYCNCIVRGHSFFFDFMYFLVKINSIMTSQEIRRKFLRFFKQKGHKIVSSSSLIPDDPSVLLTTAGMQQFKPYFIGQKDPLQDFGSKNTVSIQKSFRTSDIDEVGDESHLTFFEMLGNFSFGDYFKKETIEWTYELLIKIFQISSERISATVFAGDEKIPFDKESHGAWLKFLPEERIKKGDRSGNVWGPPGPEGPCGAANEVYVDNLEVATLVFMEYNAAKDGSLAPLPQKGVDVGWGLERLAMIVQGKNNIFETDLFTPLLVPIPTDVPERQKRIIADHVRASVFLLADGVRPSNKDRGYVLRRLIRRTLVYEHIYKIPPAVFETIIENIIKNYGEFYPELAAGREIIRQEVGLEWERFGKTLERGLRELDRLSQVDSGAAFDLYQTYGLPYEIIKELGGAKTRDLSRQHFDEELKKHQKVSRAGVEKKFGGHGIVSGDLTASSQEELEVKTRLHTATHLLNAALHKVLGDEVSQRGSDITAERTRFDFVFGRKLTDEEIRKVENMVNEIIAQDYPIRVREMPLEEAKKSGALFFYRGDYPAMVKVYIVGDDQEAFSKELCGGPHVARTGEIGRFRIIKEESSSAGIRRIRAVVE